MMKQSFPLLILRRAPKTHLMSVDSFPAHQENVFIGSLETTQKVMGYVPRHGADDRLRLTE